VLDIDFTGYLPANEDTVDAVEDIDQFVKVYYVKDRNDFIQVNRQITTIERTLIINLVTIKIT
jgi:hypothetical protein